LAPFPYGMSSPLLTFSPSTVHPQGYVFSLTTSLLPQWYY
jgi:hypothetical protein